MEKSVRSTVYLEPDLQRALKVKAAETNQSVSDLVNFAVRQALSEDAKDLEAFEARQKEPVLAFEELVKDLKRRGKL